MRILIHCNGGPTTGVGHVVRSAALAEEAIARGHLVTFAGRFEGDFLHSLLEDLGAEVWPARDFASLVGAIRELGPDLVHLDTYEEVNLQQTQEFLLSNIEDAQFGRRPAHLVVDPNLGAELVYRPGVEQTDRPVLLPGSRYTPLRRMVTMRRGAWMPRPTVDRVLVVMGGTDPRALSPRVLEVLAATRRPLHVTAVVPDRLWVACRKVASRASHLSVDLRSDVVDLPALMVDQDLVVSASGTSVWELCCLGIPMALVCASDNQLAGYRRVVGTGAALGLDRGPKVRSSGTESGAGFADPAAAARAMRDIIDDTPARLALARRAWSLVDGLGAWRVVGAWEQMVEDRRTSAPRPESATTLRIRRAVREDADALWRWRNDPATRASSRSAQRVSFDEHGVWLADTLRRNDRLLLVGSDDRGDVGTVRWDRHTLDSTEDQEVWEVSITVAPERRGESLALSLLLAGEERLSEQVGTGERGSVLCLATVHAGNTASRRLFARAGYLPDAPADGDGFGRYAKRLSGHPLTGWAF